MATVGDIDRWSPDYLQKVFDTASAKAGSLRRLGEGLEQVQSDLSTWGGRTAEAWHDSAGKVRVDVGTQAGQADKVAAAVKPAIDDVRDVKNKLAMLRQDADALGAKITDDGKVVPTREVKDTDTERRLKLPELQQQVTALEQHATTVDQEVAAALRAAVAGSPTSASTNAAETILSNAAAADNPTSSIAPPAKDDPAQTKAAATTPSLAPTKGDVALGSAGAVSGATADGVRQAALNAIKDGPTTGPGAAGPGLLKWLEEPKIAGFSRMGGAASLVGAVPAVMSDIHDGNSTAEAVTREAVGTGVGLWAGAESGAMIGAGIGSIIPGAGTGVGLVAGAVIGGVAGYGASKLVEVTWEPVSNAVGSAIHGVESIFDW